MNTSKCINLIFCFILLLSACQKDNDLIPVNNHSAQTKGEQRSYNNTLEQDFFDGTHPSSDSFVEDSINCSEDTLGLSLLIEEIIVALHQVNQTQNFLPQLIEVAGFPLWNKVIKEYEDEGLSIVSIPYLKENDQQVNNRMVVIKTKDQMLFHLQNRAFLESGIGLVKDEFGFIPLHLEGFQFLNFCVFGNANTNDESIRPTGATTREAGYWSGEECLGVQNGYLINLPKHCCSSRGASGGGPISGVIPTNSSGIPGWWNLFWSNWSVNNNTGTSTPPGNNDPTPGGGGGSIIIGNDPEPGGNGSPISEVPIDVLELQILMEHLTIQLHLSWAEVEYLIERLEVAKQLNDYLGPTDRFGEGLQFDIASYETLTTVLQPVFNFSEEERLWLAIHPEFSDQIADFHQNHNDDIAKESVHAILALKMNNWLAGPYPEDQRAAIMELYGPIGAEKYPEYITTFLILKDQWEKANPGDICNGFCEFGLALEAFWRVESGTIHLALDFCGLVPLGGELCDLTNGILYLIEGDGVNAGFSFAATIPIAGWAATGAKYAMIAVITADGVKYLKTTVVNAVTGLVKFSHKQQFRTIVGVTNPNNAAHHLIPWNKRGDDLIQLAAKAKNKPYHINHPKNGLEVETLRYNNGVHANHPQYDAKVQVRLTNILSDLENQYGAVANIPPDKASEKLYELQAFLKNLIDISPGIKINALVF